MNVLTRILLVLLRLAIGWHFFFEGLEKVESVRLGPTTTNHPWTSEPYLREATGLLGNMMRKEVGDPDDIALSRLSQAALSQEQKSDFDAFLSHYHLNEQQTQAAKKKLDASLDETVNWLLHGTKEVAKTFPSGTVKVRQTTPERVDEYRQQIQRTRTMESEDLPAFGRDVRKDQLRAAKEETRRLRMALLQDLDAHAAQWKGALAEVLTKEQKALGPMQWPSNNRTIVWVDWITRWGLIAVGAGMLLGLFTRLACLGGAGFLLLFYLTMPPFPWLPENLRAEGHYLFVNKNLIEMLALLCLATTPSGRWAGLDGLLRLLNPWRYGRSFSPEPTATAAIVPGAPSSLAPA